MSIEELLVNLTHAVNRVATALEDNTAASGAIAEKFANPAIVAPPSDVVTVAPKAAGKVVLTNTEKPAKKAPIKAAEVEAILAKEEAATVPYSDIQTLIKTNVATNRSAITKVLAKYGIKTATELLEEQYAAFYADLKAELPVVGA